MLTQSMVMNRKNIPHGTENLLAYRLWNWSVLGERRMDNPGTQTKRYGNSPRACA
jgi:hypothetical protein